MVSGVRYLDEWASEFEECADAICHVRGYRAVLAAQIGHPAGHALHDVL